MDAISLSRDFSRLATDMAGSRGRLAAQENRNLYPNHSWPDSFANYATQLDNFRIGLSRFAPGVADPLVSALGADSRSLARVGGRMGLMAEKRITMGYGFAEAFSRPIADAQAAADLLLRIPNKPGATTKAA